MIGTLWRSESGICVCVECDADGWMRFYYLNDPNCKACIHTSTIHTYYTQLTQPTEKK